VGSGVSEVQAAFLGPRTRGIGLQRRRLISPLFGGTSNTCLLADHERRQCDPGKRAIAIPAPITKETHRSLAFLPFLVLP
jgi:hypothetical protein